MVKLQHNTYGILAEISFTEALFPEYSNEVSLDPLMAYKSTEDTDTM